MQNQRKGLIHLYCGDGKGKTSAAVGLSVRAAGRKYAVLFVQFMKDGTSSEREGLRRAGVTVEDCPELVKFSFDMTEEEKREAAKENTGRLEEVFLRASREGMDLLILDEVVTAVSVGFIEEEHLITLLLQKPEGMEVVMTGQNPGERLCEMAHYLSEIKKRKHPFDEGMPARPGIEY